MADELEAEWHAELEAFRAEQQAIQSERQAIQSERARLQEARLEGAYARGLRDAFRGEIARLRKLGAGGG